MMRGDVDDSGVRVQLRLGGKDRVIVVSQDRMDQVRRVAHTIWSEPFAKRTWSELFFFVVSSLLAVVGIAFIAVTMFAGIVLAITFVGVIIIAASVRGARGIGGFHRGLARGILDEQILDPEPFSARPGFFGWLQAALRDRAGWRSVAYSVIKVPLVIFGVWFAFSVWVDAFLCLTYPVSGGGTGRPREFGL